MEGMIFGDSLFEYDTDTTDQTRPSSSKRKSIGNRSWTEVIQEKRQNFHTPGATKTTTKSQSRTEITVTKSLTDRKTNAVNNWVNTAHLFDDDDIVSEDSPTKYLAIESVESPETPKTTNNNNTPFLQRKSKSDIRKHLATKSKTLPAKQVSISNLTPARVPVISNPIHRLKLFELDDKEPEADDKIESIWSPSTAKFLVKKPKKSSLQNAKSVQLSYSNDDVNNTFSPSNNSDWDHEMLESTICEVESPAKSRCTPKQLISSQASESSNLSDKISDDVSTPSQKSSKLIDSTPIAQWIVKPNTPMPMDAEISEFDSPKKSERQLLHSENFSEQWTVVEGKRRKKRRLTEQIKGLLTRYESSVRMFAHDYRLGKFDEDLAITLVIRSICGREDKIIWTICHDVRKSSNRCVCFKPQYSNDIYVGVVLKLYQPWTEIDMPGVPSPVIISADFYRIRKKSDDFGISKEYLDKLLCMPIPPVLNNLQTVTAGPFLNVFENLLPYSLKNENTQRKQLKKCKATIDLDVVILKFLGEKQILMSDSDEIFCVLLLPETVNLMNKAEELLQILKPRKYIKFTNLAINSKTNYFEDSSLFSMLRTFGSKQMFFYTVALLNDSNWEVEVQLEIPYPSTIEHPQSRQKSILQIQQSNVSEDIRVSIRCVIEKRSDDDWVTVRDSSGDRMKVALISSVKSANHNFSSLSPEKHVFLDFLRIFRGRPSLDDFSTVQEL